VAPFPGEEGTLGRRAHARGGERRGWRWKKEAERGPHGCERRGWRWAGPAGGHSLVGVTP
jgi:hypothetical protein